MYDDIDNIDEMEAKDTANVLPKGWLILFWGLIIWGVFYFAVYSPMTSGWTQVSEYEESLKK